MPSVMAINMRNRTRVMFMLFASLCQAIHDLFAGIVPLTRHAHVQPGDQPRHKELREGKQIGDVGLSPYSLVHGLGVVTDQVWQQEVVHDEKNGCGDDKPGFGFQKLLELVHCRDAIPLARSGAGRGRGRRLWRPGCLLTFGHAVPPQGGEPDSPKNQFLLLLSKPTLKKDGLKKYRPDA